MPDAIPGTPVTSANGNTQTNTGLSVAYPAAAVDTLMVIEISGDASGTGVAPTGMAAAGWTRDGEALDTNAGTASSSSYIGVFHKVMAAGSASGSASFTWTNAGQMAAICTPYTSYDSTTPVVFLAGVEKTTSDTAYTVSGTTTDTGLLAYAFANRAGSTAFSGLSDNARAQSTVSTTGCTIIGRITAASVANGTAYGKTATGTNTSVGTSVAYLIRGSSSTDTATVGMTQTAAVGVTGSSSGSTTVAMAQIGGVAVSGSKTVQSAATMAQTNTVTVTPATLLTTWLARGAPYYVAHRGGDNDWVEMTRDAYTHAIANGATAINIDAVKCSTGEFVASHDLTTGRVFGTNLTIGSSTWTSLSGLTTTTGGFPIEKVADLLAAFPNVVVFVENKGNSSDDSAFLDMLDAAGGPARIVVKQYYTASTVSTDAHARGYTTWGYYFAADAVNLASTQSRWDLLGLDYTDTNGADWTNFLATGKIVLGHVVPSAAGATQAFSEGANGIMTGKILGVVPGNQQTASEAMAQTGSISVTGSVARSAAVGMTQTAAVGVAGAQSVSAGPSMAQTGVMGVASAINRVAGGTLAQTGQISVTGTDTANAASTMSQSTTVTLSGVGQTSGALPMAQTNALAATGVSTQSVAAPMGQTAAVAVVGVVSRTAAIPVAQSAGVAVTGSAVGTAALTVAQSGALSAAGSSVAPAAMPVSQIGILSLTGSAIARQASVPITGTSTVTVTGTASAPGAAAISMAQTGATSIGGAGTSAAPTAMSQSSAVGLVGSTIIAAAIGMTGTGQMTIAPVGQAIAALLMVEFGAVTLAGSGAMLGSIVMASASALGVTGDVATPPLNAASLLMDGTGAISLAGAGIMATALAMLQSNQFDIGTSIPVIRRHIKPTVVLGELGWSASTIVPIIGG